MSTVALQNLGCSKNQIDGERILHLFKCAGYEINPDFSRADVIVVNTCAFIREAQEEAIDAILQTAHFKTSGHCRKIIVSGCFSQRYRSLVKAKFPEVDLWVGVNDWQHLLKNELNTSVDAGFKHRLRNRLQPNTLKSPRDVRTGAPIARYRTSEGNSAAGR